MSEEPTVFPKMLPHPMVPDGVVMLLNNPAEVRQVVEIVKENESLRAEVTRLREENAGLRERNDRVIAIEGSGIPWRDVDDNYEYAASAVRAKVARAEAEIAAARAEERERVIEEAAQVADDYDVDMDINVDPCSAIAYKIRALAALSAAQPPEEA